MSNTEPINDPLPQPPIVVASVSQPPIVVVPASKRPATGVWVAVAAGVAVLVLALVAGYFAQDTIRGQQTRIEGLNADLSATRVQRDEVTAQRGVERGRADTAEASGLEQTRRLAESEQSMAGLQVQMDGSLADLKRLQGEVESATTREQSASTAARDATANAAALTTARANQQRIQDAFVTYSDAAGLLSDTRDTMIDTLRDQIDAERAERWTVASSLVDKYNKLVEQHNRELADSRTAVASLKRLLN